MACGLMDRLSRLPHCLYRMYAWASLRQIGPRLFSRLFIHADMQSALATHTLNPSPLRVCYSSPPLRSAPQTLALRCLSPVLPSTFPIRFSASSLRASGDFGWFHQRPSTALAIQPRSCVVQQLLTIALLLASALDHRGVAPITGWCGSASRQTTCAKPDIIIAEFIARGFCLIEAPAPRRHPWTSRRYSSRLLSGTRLPVQTLA
ncbi:hypothetical protein F5144DRAFT_205416 [Chaetomium tenue]|uniref:Uncharacterized protein n=1 Tax=Chaetomium tenue TaxID=1854479 RepID=A0ACB7PDB3_9PEZI|nr:hypothetical protein F5144DRAFT_205416 [Chaetomium globosum]